MTCMYRKYLMYRSGYRLLDKPKKRLIFAKNVLNGTAIP